MWRRARLNVWPSEAELCCCCPLTPIWNNTLHNPKQNKVKPLQRASQPAASLDPQQEMAARLLLPRAAAMGTGGLRTTQPRRYASKHVLVL